MAAATAAAADLRKRQPEHFPPAAHSWFRLGNEELGAPLLCGVCHDRLEPDNLFQVDCCYPARVQCVCHSSSFQKATLQALRGAND